MLYVIGNWKMQLTEKESEALAKEVVSAWAAQAAANPNVQVVVSPSHLALEEVGKIVKGTGIALGAQDVFWEDKGAFTGEVSAATLKELGVEFCLVGHSERRQHLGETDEMINKKVKALLRHNITPVICVGETAAEREGGSRDAVVIGQVRTALEGVRPEGSQRVIIAYEPRWVIGTGHAVAPVTAAEMHHLIVGTLHMLLPADVVDHRMTVIYGGAVDAKNADSLMSYDVINGALVGGASLRPAEFTAIAEIAADIRR